MVVHYQSVRLFLFCFVFRATAMACGSSQVSSQIWATAADLCHSHSNVGSELICNLNHCSWQCWIRIPLSKARMKPAYSRILVGCFSTSPQQELPGLFFIYDSTCEPSLQSCLYHFFLSQYIVHSILTVLSMPIVSYIFLCQKNLSILFLFLYNEFNFFPL